MLWSRACPTWPKPNQFCGFLCHALPTLYFTWSHFLFLSVLGARRERYDIFPSFPSLNSLSLYVRNPFGNRLQPRNLYTALSQFRRHRAVRLVPRHHWQTSTTTFIPSTILSSVGRTTSHTSLCVLKTRQGFLRHCWKSQTPFAAIDKDSYA